MKRGLIILTGVLMAIQMVAQPRLRQPEMYVGLHGGVLFSMVLFTPKVAGSDILTDRVLISGNGGMVFRYVGHKVCGFQLELNYMQRGWHENTDEVEGGAHVHYTRRLNYLEVPFLTHFYFGKKAVRGFLNVGPQFGVCFLESESGIKHPSEQEQYKSLDNKFDWGVAGGLGMLVRTNKAGTFQLEARVNYSLGDHFSNKKTDYFSHSNSLNISANIGYLWEMKPKAKMSSEQISQSNL